MVHIFMTYGLPLLWDSIVAFCIIANLWWPDVAKRYGVGIERRYWCFLLCVDSYGGDLSHRVLAASYSWARLVRANSNRPCCPSPSRKVGP